MLPLFAEYRVPAAPYPNLLKTRKMDTVFTILDTTVSNIGVFSENGYDFLKFGYASASSLRAGVERFREETLLIFDWKMTRFRAEIAFYSPVFP